MNMKHQVSGVKNESEAGREAHWITVRKRRREGREARVMNDWLWEGGGSEQ